MSLRRIPASSEEAINTLIQLEGIDTNKISDGFHTFEELYKHRVMLYMCVCRLAIETMQFECWKSTKHNDESVYDGWFIMGLVSLNDPTLNITYHLPMTCFDNCDFAVTINKAPEWDGHSSFDVLERLSKMFL